MNSLGSWLHQVFNDERVLLRPPQLHIPASSQSLQLVLSANAAFPRSLDRIF